MDNRRLYYVVVLAMMTLPLACRWGGGLPSSANALINNYHYRLGNVLDRAIDSPNEPVLVSFPSQRILKQTTASSSISLLEFWQLRRCRLHTLLANRNSGLGNVLTASQTWIYHAQFLRLAPPCLETICPDTAASCSEGDDALKASIERALRIKQQHKYRTVWNATMASHEFSRVFSTAVRPLPVNDDGAGVLLSAWQQLHQRMLAFESTDEPPASIESVLQIIGASRYLGALQQSIRLVHERLPPLTRAIQQRASECRFNPRQKAAVKTVFLKYYIGDVQPYLARVSREVAAHQHGLEPIRAYFQTPASHLSEAGYQAFEDYWAANWAQENSHVGGMRRIIKSHALAWQALSSQCALGLVPES